MEDITGGFLFKFGQPGDAGANDHGLEYVQKQVLQMERPLNMLFMLKNTLRLKSFRQFSDSKVLGEDTKDSIVKGITLWMRAT